MVPYCLIFKVPCNVDSCIFLPTAVNSWASISEINPNIFTDIFAHYVTYVLSFRLVLSPLYMFYSNQLYIFILDYKIRNKMTDKSMETRIHIYITNVL